MGRGSRSGRRGGRSSWVLIDGLFLQSARRRSPETIAEDAGYRYCALYACEME